VKWTRGWQKLTKKLTEMNTRNKGHVAAIQDKIGEVLNNVVKMEENSRKSKEIALPTKWCEEDDRLAEM